MDEFDTGNIRKLETNLNKAGLQNVREFGHKELDFSSQFSWFDNEDLINFILS